LKFNLLPPVIFSGERGKGVRKGQCLMWTSNNERATATTATGNFIWKGDGGIVIARVWLDLM
jgi:hypothetical protein